MTSTLFRPLLRTVNANTASFRAPIQTLRTIVPLHCKRTAPFSTMSHLQAKDEKSKHPSENDSDTSGLPHNEKKQVHENRMDRPPYTEDPKKAFKKVYDASCFCGNVKYEIAREKPLDAKFCHCPTCQKLHGAPFQWAAIVPKDDVRFTSGKEQLIYWMPEKKSQEYILPCKVACKNCRTPIMDEGRNMLLLFPTLINFPDLKHKRHFYPSCHIFYSRRAVDVVDGLPKWSKHKDESERIPESIDENREKQEAENKL